MKDIKIDYYPNKYIKKKLVLLYNRDMYPPPPSVLWRTLELHIHLYNIYNGDRFRYSIPAFIEGGLAIEIQVKFLHIQFLLNKIHRL
jgi:hypothetical protein